MSTCTFCTQEATHRENTAPYNAFCGSACQEIHYALIAAGGKREREEEEESNPIDFTDVVPPEVLRLIMLKSRTFQDVINLCKTNKYMRSLCNNSNYREGILKDPIGKKLFEMYILELKNTDTKDTTGLKVWIDSARLSGINIDLKDVFLIAIKHNNILLFEFAMSLSDYDFMVKNLQQFVNLSLTLGRFKVFKLLEKKYFFRDYRIKIEAELALLSGNVELIEYLILKDGVSIEPKKAVDAVIKKGNYEALQPLFLKSKAIQISNAISAFLSHHKKYDEIRMFLTKTNPPAVALLDVFHNAQSLDIDFVIEAVRFLGDRIRGSLIARALTIIEFKPDDQQYFETLVSHPNMTKDDKLYVFSKLLQKTEVSASGVSFFGGFGGVYSYIRYPDFLMWMVKQNHVDPSFDENYLYHHNEYEPSIRNFLRRFKQVRDLLPSY